MSTTRASPVDPRASAAVVQNEPAERKPQTVAAEPEPEVTESESDGESATQVTEAPTPVVDIAEPAAEAPTAVADNAEPAAEAPTAVADNAEPAAEAPTAVAEDVAAAVEPERIESPPEPPAVLPAAAEAPPPEESQPSRRGPVPAGRLSSVPSRRSIHGHAAVPRGRYLLTLCLGALGVVYGDIGTSPLYALGECFHKEHGIGVTVPNVLGVLSLIFWALTITITLKYLVYVLRADNRGEGGVLALMALALGGLKARYALGAVTALGLFGAALLYGDGMITPAISVLSAVEGLKFVTPKFEEWVVPLTVLILIGLFLPQKYGTARVGAVFGPVMLVWFAVLSVIGLVHIVQHPGVLAAISPHHAIGFMIHNRMLGFLILGSVFLCVTGGEALYADMGHFGRRPIRMTWIALVGPALILNYFGQGALLISDASAAENPFYLAAPKWALVPMVLLSTMATIIASQAVITGAYSLTRQAMMLGFWPRVAIRHTSSREIGQIYVPTINWFLMLATIGLVLGFKSASNLAAAYGIAVTTTMVITTLLAYQVAHHRWGWSKLGALSLTIALAAIDLAFFGANAVKITHGGWFPLLVAGGVFVIMTTWKKGRALLGERIRAQIVPLSDFFEVIRVERPARVPGTAVFMTSNAEGTPPAMMHNFFHNRVVHQQVILLTVITTEQARVMPEDRVQVEQLPEGFIRVLARYGFMEQPDIPALLEEKHIPGWSIEHTTFFLGRETVLASGGGGMGRWREHLFSFMSRNSQRAATFFNVPPDRVMEIGSQIEL